MLENSRWKHSAGYQHIFKIRKVMQATICDLKSGAGYGFMLQLEAKLTAK